MLFKNAKTCIITNGFISKYVTISRSIRQGCPIVPMLYILHAEPLASTIRDNTNIKGIKLPHPSDQENQEKLNMFADDTQLFKRDEKSIEETFNVLNIYEKTPGAKINLNKIVEIYLGRWKNKTPKLRQIKWSKDPMKALGVIQGHNVNIDAL